MPLFKVLALSHQEKTELERLEKFDSNWRVRERAKTLLLLCAGYSCPQVAEKMNLHFRTISYTRKAWLEAKFESLPDRPRSGAPLKITPPQRASIAAWAEAEPLSALQLLARHLDAGGTPVHLKTMVNLLGQENFVWKRTRASLKKKGMSPLFALHRLRFRACANKPQQGRSCWATSMRRAFPVSIPIEAPGPKWVCST
jgi:transposase